ncbi:MAG: undecaprenyl/decaprenyl-phosphate alpha-N-acetylglucosaminyl 1-phosphate transferase [Clostridium sp.]|nr:undecaprenyl/decaprenyl-phosphate alpha-N-acetylglucosaminyl 1-phosphate transferase [Clostridium sp.]MCM1444718.1 undecaprenyl/decaprenyl-phosphate alpha-N-acetylglucosaminyl 1-phosphate transferase [Candidatus Amulumruptor caecigallinarius]
MDLILKIMLIVCSTFLFVSLFVPIVKKIANHVGALDMPNARKVHKNPMPRLGGIGIYAGFLLGYMIFCEPSPLMNSVLIGSFIIVFTGIVDDINPVSAKYKLIAQFLAALIVVIYGNLQISSLSAFGFYIEFGIFSYPITILFILGCINCMNLIDGLDGLASGISSIFFLTIGIIATIKGSFDISFLLTFIMLGATLGFLVHNFNPASIFMGDSGSMFLGFIISVITLTGYKNVMMSSLIIPLLILAIPILDTLFAIIRRSIKGEKVSEPDRYHIHHQLLNRNLSQRATVVIIYIVNILFAFASIVYVLKDRILGYLIYGILLLIVVFFVAKTNVIFEHKDKK